MAATTAHAQTTTTPDPAAATPQTAQDAKTTYGQQRDERKAADQSVADSRRELKQQQSQTRELKSQLKQQREQAKQQKRAAEDGPPAGQSRQAAGKKRLSSR